MLQGMYNTSRVLNALNAALSLGKLAYEKKEDRNENLYCTMVIK